MNNVSPTIKAILLCDSIIAEVGTNKKSLIGVFENINFQSFPCKHYKLSVYINFTSAQGEYDFKLELIDLQTNTVIGGSALPEVNIPDKLGCCELAFNLMGLEFKHPGKYEFQISTKGKVFGFKTFNVIHRQAKQKS